MEGVIRKKDWDFKYYPERNHTTYRIKILNKIEDWTGYRIGEYKNYKRLGKISRTEENRFH